jgi:hypothetical protein
MQGMDCLDDRGHPEAHRFGVGRYGPLVCGTRGTWPKALSAFEWCLQWQCHFMQKLESGPRIEFENMHPACDGIRDPTPDRDQSRLVGPDVVSMIGARRVGTAPDDRGPKQALR